MKEKIAEKAIFLDRDDTIIADPGYINNPDQVKLLPGAAQGLNELRKMGFKLVIVSNQSGIARGILTETTLAKIHQRLAELLAEDGASIDKIYYCPYYKQGTIPKYRKDSDERKPKPGMLLRAAKEMGLELEESWIVGNSYVDVSAGKSAGCRTILIKSHTNRPVKNLTDPDPDFEAINLKEAANIVKRELSLSGRNVQGSPEEKIEPKPQEKAAETEPEVETETGTEVAAETNEPPREMAKTEPKEDLPKQRPFKAVDIADEQNRRLQKTEEKLLKETNRTEQLLEEIKLVLKSRSRQDAFDEFSVMKLVAGVLQVVVLACVFAAVLYKISPIQKDVGAFTAIGFAIVFQLMALTLYIMHNDKK